MNNTDCILTGRKVKYDYSENTTYYDIKIANRKVTIFICHNCKSKIESSKIQHHIISGLIANGKWPERVFLICEDHENNTKPPADSETIILSDYLSTTDYPKNPNEKLNNLFLNLFKLQAYDGEPFEVNIKDEEFWIKNYFKNADECQFYIDGLIEKKYVTYPNTMTKDDKPKFKITHLGLNKAAELFDEGINSNNCFVAMWFDDSMKPFREAIKNAIVETGFNPIIIDEVHLSSDKTIPDGILSGIKKSKFCIADFTNHRNGVYFESGFALGLGKPVIYLCNKNDFDKTHFDIKQLQHIIYISENDLKMQLIDKIEAWIK